MSAESRKETVRRYCLEVWGGPHQERIEEFVTPGYVYGAPGMEGVRGAQAARELAEMYRTAFPDLSNTIEQQFADGDVVVTRGTVRATHRGAFAGLAPTGRVVTVPWILISRFEGDRIAEDWEVYDSLGLMQQLGVQQIGVAGGASATAAR